MEHKVLNLFATTFAFAAAVLITSSALAAPVARYNDVDYYSIAEVIEELPEPVTNYLDQVTILDPDAEVPDGYEITSQTNLVASVEAEPFCITAFSAGTIVQMHRVPPSREGDHYYKNQSNAVFECSSNGRNWKSYPKLNFYNWEEIHLANAGDKVYLRAPYGVRQTISWPVDKHAWLTVSNGTIGVSGDLTTLHDYDGYHFMTNSCQFAYFFKDCTGLVSVGQILRADRIGEDCYKGMFKGCTSLTETLELPKRSFGEGCYSEMYAGCTSLTNVLPINIEDVTTSRTCERMFAGCTALKTPPTVIMNRLKEKTFSGMFTGCTGLTNTMNIAVDATAKLCFEAMYDGCTGLTEAPELPWTTVAVGSYSNMFIRCTGLTKPPMLPATKVGVASYAGMFEGCTGLTEAPELPAQGVSMRTYKRMFAGCTGIKTAPALPATTLGNNCYQEMFIGCTGITNAPALPATTMKNTTSYCYQEMFSGCTGIKTAPELPATTLNMASGCYYKMFFGCTGITNTPALPATTLAQTCYKEMFSGCTSLTRVAALPAGTLQSSCYEGMYSNCTSIVVKENPDPDFKMEWKVPAASGSSNWNKNMFFGTASEITEPVNNVIYYTKNFGPCCIGYDCYPSIQAAIDALEEPKNDHLGQIRVLYSDAECPHGYYIDGESVKAYQPDVVYIDENGGEKSVNSYTIVTADTGRPWGIGSIFDPGWYVVTGDVSRAHIFVTGDVHLILCDGAKLTVSADMGFAGIGVTNGTSIAIYGQKDGTGELEVIGGPMVTNGKPGIGGYESNPCGTVTINGGVVKAYGTTNAAGIGGEYNMAGGTVVINGGKVTAVGDGAGAGIGCGKPAAAVDPVYDHGTLTVGRGIIVYAGADAASVTKVAAPYVGNGAYYSTDMLPKCRFDLIDAPDHGKAMWYYDDNPSVTNEFADSFYAFTNFSVQVLFVADEGYLIKNGVNFYNQMGPYPATMDQNRDLSLSDCTCIIPNCCDLVSNGGATTNVQPSIEYALKAATDGDQILMREDFTTNGSIEFKHSVTLDCRGHGFTVEDPLTIRDGVSVVLTNSISEAGGFTVNNGAEFKINAGGCLGASSIYPDVSPNKLMYDNPSLFNSIVSYSYLGAKMITGTGAYTYYEDSGVNRWQIDNEVVKETYSDGDDYAYTESYASIVDLLANPAPAGLSSIATLTEAESITSDIELDLNGHIFDGIGTFAIESSVTIGDSSGKGYLNLSRIPFLIEGSNLYIKGGSYSFDPTDYLVDGCVAVKDPSPDYDKWTVCQKVDFPKPKTGLVYTGAPQFGFDSTNGAAYVSGEINGVAAGSHPVVFAPAAGYAWENGSLTNVTVSYVIDAATITYAFVGQKEPLIYNGYMQTPVLTNCCKTVDGCAVTVYYAAVDGASYSTEPPKVESAGIHTNYFYVAAANHNCSDVLEYYVAVDKKPLRIVANDKSIHYGDSPSGNGVFDKYNDFVGYDDFDSLGGELAYDFTYAQYGDVGSGYTITPKGLTSDNYEISYEPGTMTVLQKTISIDGITATTRVYDGSTTVSLTGGALSGLVNSDTVGFTLPSGSAASADAGNDIAVSFMDDVTLTGAKAGNYTLTQPAAGSVKVSITRKELTVDNIDATDRPYDGTVDVEITGGDLVGIVGADDVTATMPVAGKAADKNVGTGKAVTFDAIVLEGTKAGNYSITQPVIDVEITKASLNIKADDKSCSMGDPAPAYTCTCTGFIAGESEAVFDSPVVCACDYNASVRFTDASKKFAIVPSGATASNYDITFANGTLTVAGQFEVTYNALGGAFDGVETLVKTQLVTEAYSQIGTIVPVRDGYKLIGWFFSWTNNAVQVKKTSPFVLANHTLYAKWESTKIDPKKPPVISGDVSGDTIVITGPASGKSVGTDFVIPDRVSNGEDGAMVVEVADNSFAKARYTKSSIAKLTTPVFLKRIGDNAFNGVSSLAELKLVPSYRVDDPTKLQDVEIGRGAFAGTGLNRIVLPQNVKKIGKYAFQNCKEVSEIQILGRIDPANIGTAPFAQCGIDVGGVTVKICPDLASDTAYINKLLQNCPNVTIDTHDIPYAVDITDISVGGGKCTLKVGVATMTKWNNVNADSVQILYSADPSVGLSVWTQLPKKSTKVNADGSVTIVVDDPGGTAFFKATIR